MTDQILVETAPDRRLGFLLPGRWWHIDLADGADVVRQVRLMSREVVGKQDDRAQLRRDVQVSVEKAALAAADAGASDFYFAVEVVPGVPIPASLAVYRPELPAGVLAVDLEQAADGLATSLRRLHPSAAVDSMPAAQEHFALVRSVRTMVGPTFAATGVERAEELVVSYWALRNDAVRPLLLSFTSALVSMKDELVPLFDAIVSTVEWSEPDPA